MKKTLLLFAPIALFLLVFADCKDEKEQTIDLPASVKIYIDSHYAGYEVEESELDTLCNGTAVYEVELEDSDDKEADLTFDTEGNLLFTKTGYPVTQLPAPVSAGIAAGYAGYATKEVEKLSFPNGDLQYETELKKGASNLEVLFAADGTVICEASGDDDDE